MFDHVFKKKEVQFEGKIPYKELARRSRVARQKEYARRPRTAPSPSSSTYDLHETDRVITHRHSLGDESMSAARHTPREPLRFSSPDALAPLTFLPPPVHPLSLQPGRRPTSSSYVENNPCPRMMPERRASSNELRNPFRSDTGDSMASTGHTESFDSFAEAEAEVPVHRTVRAFRPAQTPADASHAPQKAAIFTTEMAGGQLQVPRSNVNAMSDPFTDKHAAPVSPSVSMTGAPSPREETMSPRSLSRRWSLLKSPRRASQDFLQVKIPTGIMSPVRESRLAFWSKA